MITKNTVTIDTLQEDLNIMGNFVQYFEFSPIVYSFNIYEIDKNSITSYDEILKKDASLLEINTNGWESYLTEHINEWMTSSVKLLLFNLYFNIAIKTKEKRCDDIYNKFMCNKFVDKKEYLNNWITNKFIKNLKEYTNNDVLKIIVVSNQVVATSTNILIECEDKFIHLNFEAQE